MNRALFALAVGVVGLGMMGCAEGVDDPPEVPPATVATQPKLPRGALSDDLRLPRLQDTIQADNSPSEAKRLPQLAWPIPTPPGPEQSPEQP